MSSDEGCLADVFLGNRDYLESLELVSGGHVLGFSEGIEEVINSWQGVGIFGCDLVEFSEVYD